MTGVRPNNSRLLSIDDSVETHTPETTTQDTEEGTDPVEDTEQHKRPPPNNLNETNEERDEGTIEEMMNSGGGKKVGDEVGEQEGKGVG